jgi:hypothetical protein
MNIYLLEVRNNTNTQGLSWANSAIRFVVAARTGHEARQLAGLRHGNEGHTAWLDREVTSCIVIGRTFLDTGMVIVRQYNTTYLTILAALTA